MTETKPLSVAAVSVLQGLSDGFRYGFDIMDATELPSGTVYPILGRLSKAGLVRSRWEESSVAHREKRPPRRYYVLTDAGKDMLASSLRHYRTLGGRLPDEAVERTPSRAGA